MDPVTIFGAVVLSMATFVRSAFGFGEALIAVPLLALIMPVDVAAPVAVLVSTTVAAVIVAQDWRSIHMRSALRLVLATLPGIPVGLWLLSRVPEAGVKGTLGLLIIAFSTFVLSAGMRRDLDSDRSAWLFGLAGGVLGGAYGMNGPPLVVFGTLRRWSPQHFRATLQAYFLPASAAVMAGYWATGLWTPRVTSVYLGALPFVAAAIFLGRALNRRLEGGTFLRIVHIVLIVTGVILLTQALDSPQSHNSVIRP